MDVSFLGNKVFKVCIFALEMFIKEYATRTQIVYKLQYYFKTDIGFHLHKTLSSNFVHCKTRGTMLNVNYVLAYLCTTMITDRLMQFILNLQTP